MKTQTGCVSLRANAGVHPQVTEVKARDWEGDEALHYDVEGHLGPDVYHLPKSDLGSDCDQSPSLNPDWKRGNAKQVQSEWLRAAI